MESQNKTTFGVIVGNRGFFPDILARDGRDEILRVLESGRYRAVCLTPEETKYGAVETLHDAQRCAELFKKHRDEIDGLIVTLPNFGDERGVANAVRMSGLDVPVLVHAFLDDPEKMLMGGRRDSFCGKISVCNNLWQYGIRFSLTRQHTVSPSSDSFREDLSTFAATCRVVKGIRAVRVGMIGARPAAFNTVRFSEKLLENAGITVETIDLSEILGRINRLADGDSAVQGKFAAVQNYVPTGGIPPEALTKMAKFAVVAEEWMEANGLAGSAVQCWTAMQEFFGIMPCTVMSVMSENLMPSACETDILGTIGMYILQLASGTPSAIVDWNNNYGNDRNKAVIFHCSNLPKHFFQDVRMDFNEIIGSSMGKEKSFGTLVGRLKSGPMTYCRASTDDLHGRMRAYVGEGEMTPDPVESFGGYGVVTIPGLQELMQYVSRNGYEHHVCASLSNCASAVEEALSNYKGWDVHHHRPEGTC